MHIGASFDSGDHRHSNVRKILQNLRSFVVHYAPYFRVRYVTKRRKINRRNEITSCASQNHYLVRAILRNPVKGIDKLGMILRRKGVKWTTVFVEFGNQYAVYVSIQSQ